MNGANSNPPSVFESGVEGVCHSSIFLPMPAAKYRPHGENSRAVTAVRKEKWYMAILRGRFVRMARPSSSTESRRFPLGFNARRCMFFRWANGRVCDLLLRALLSLRFS